MAIWTGDTKNAGDIRLLTYYEYHTNEILKRLVTEIQRMVEILYAACFGRDSAAFKMILKYFRGVSQRVK